MAWSADPEQGYLTKKGIEQMRTQLSNDIFRDGLLSIPLSEEGSVLSAGAGRGNRSHGSFHLGYEVHPLRQSGHRRADGSASRNAVLGQRQEGVRLSQKVSEDAGGCHRG